MLFYQDILINLHSPPWCNKLNPLMAPGWNRIRATGGRRALSPLRHPCSPKMQQNHF